jgi:hypothetical protein
MPSSVRILKKNSQGWAIPLPHRTLPHHKVMFELKREQFRSALASPKGAKR